jgi:diguanylate cyclase (GGDEF)-like protein
MKILVVDSDELFSRLLRTKLEKWGHSVVIEHDGDSAFARIDKEPYRMVIMDLDINGMDGIELCRRIRRLKRSRYTYIMIYSSITEKKEIMDSLEAGADDFLNKPLNPLELQLRIKAGKRLLNLEDMLLEGAGVDKSTGVVNAASFRQFFRVSLAEYRRGDASGALIYVGVMNYHQCFNQHGYNPTEALMSEVARMLIRVSRESDLVARISEDSFCLMAQHTYWDKCRPIIEKIESLSQGITIVSDDAELRPQIAVGAVNFPQGDLTYEQILDEAEPLYYQEAAAVAGSSD